MVIGAGVTVGEKCVIEQSVIGEGCRIGAGVRIVDSYLWAGAVVEDNAHLEGAIVASQAMAKTHAGERGKAAIDGDEDLGRRRSSGVVTHVVSCFF